MPRTCRRRLPIGSSSSHWASQPPDGGGDRIAVLTPREREVLALVGAGLSNAEIGRQLYLVEGTVKAYVSAVLSRLEVRNRVQAAVLAYEAGLVPAAE